MNRYRTFVCPRQRGASMVEFFVSLAVFVPFFVGIPLLGKYADIKSKTIEASRYVVWERTIFSDPDPAASWHDGEASKTDADILIEAERRMFGPPSQGLHDRTLKENPTWRTMYGEKLLGVAKDDNGDPVDRNDPDALQHLAGEVRELSPSELIDGLAWLDVKLVDIVATDGIDAGGIIGDMGGLLDGAAGFLDSVDGLLDSVANFLGVPEFQCEIPGMNILGGNEDGGGLGLGKNNYAVAQVQTPVFDRLGSANGDFSFTADAAILSNAWTVPDPEHFETRVDNLVPNQLLGCITAPGVFTFGLLGKRGGAWYGEGKLAHPIYVESPDQALPTELIQ